MFGGSLNFGKSKSGSSSNYSQDVFGPQADALGNMYGQQSNLFNSTLNTMNRAQPGASEYMNQTAADAQGGWQNQMQGGAYGNLGIGEQLMNSLARSDGRPSAMSEINSMIMGGEGNNYADAMKQQYMQDASQAQNQMMGNLDARAAASGMSGGSRHGIAQAQGLQDINQNLQSQMAQTGFDTFDKDLDRKLQIAGMADQGTFNRQNMLMNMLGRQQDTVNQGVQNSTMMQNLGMGQYQTMMMPWNMMNMYAQNMGDPTVLSEGSSTSSSKSNNFGGSFAF